MRTRLTPSLKKRKLTVTVDPHIYDCSLILSRIASSSNLSRFVEEALYDWVFDSLLLSYNNGYSSIHLVERLNRYEWHDDNNDLVKDGFSSIKEALSWYEEYQQNNILK